MKKDFLIYQGKSGAIELKGDFQKETLWARQNQIAELFEIDRSVVTKHINKILKENEVDQKSNVQKMHIPNSDKPVAFYSLDVILAVGYRANSSKAIKFRQWATKTLRTHLTQGYTINRSQVAKNYDKFMKAVAEVKALLPASNLVNAEDALEPTRLFANTWFWLDAYDRSSLPTRGLLKKDVEFALEELTHALAELKSELLRKKEIISKLQNWPR